MPTVPPSDGAAMSSPIPKENDSASTLRDATRIGLMEAAAEIADAHEKEDAWKEIRKLFELRLRDYGLEELRPHVLRMFAELTPIAKDRGWALKLLIEKAALQPSVKQWQFLASLMCKEEAPLELLELYLVKCVGERYRGYALRVQRCLEKRKAGKPPEEKRTPSPFGKDIPSFLQPTKKSPS